eukprot:1733977-Prymnesium_polylepis.1
MRPVVHSHTTPKPPQRRESFMKESVHVWNSQVYLWPFEPPVVREAAFNFEARHLVLSRRAERSLQSLGPSGHDAERRRRFQADLWELRAQRFGVQPLRLRALVSPRQGPLGHARLEGLQLGGAGGGPWQMPQRTLEMES